MSTAKNNSSPHVRQAGSDGAAAHTPARAGESRLQVGDVAVIGMSGRFPGAQDLKQFWRNLLAGRCDIGDVPASRWDMETIYDSRGGSRHKSYCKSGAFVDGIEHFDPRFFRMTPRQALFLDPQQRAFLEECWKAFEDAGYSDRDLDGTRCGVFAGCKAADYQMRLFTLDPSEMDETDGHLLGGNDISMLPARISYFLNLRGPSLPINTACSSSMVALHLACESINSGVCDMALAGGVEFMTTPGLFVSLSASGALSRAGLCRAFDERADGMILGEGVCAVVLKSVSRALADGDHIYGVIKVSGLNQDGRSNGINAPNGQAQTALECEVYEAAGVSPETIGYVECHGTGTVLGDPIEVNALTDAFARHTGRKSFCPIGSVKSNIGHPLSAAGLAGLIKVLLCFEHEQIPPAAGFSAYNKHLNIEESPFFVNTEPLDWPRGSSGARRAALSSFGFSGTNGHAVIEDAPAHAPTQAPAAPYHLILISAKTEAALGRRLSQLDAWLAEHETADLGRVAYTLHRGRSHFQWRAAFVVSNARELRDALAERLGQTTRGRQTGAPAEEQRTLCARVGRRLQSGGLDPLAHRGALLILAEAYLNGALPNWEEIHRAGEVRRIPLPTYPFERERYWIDAPVERLLWPRSEKDSPAAAHAPAEKTAAPPSGLRTVVFRPDWQRAASVASTTGGDLLLFHKHDELYERLLKLNGARGHNVILVEAGDSFERVADDHFRVAPGDAGDFVKLRDALAAGRGGLPTRALFLWPLDDADARTTQARLGAGVYTLLQLSRAWLAADGGRPALSLVYAHRLRDGAATPEHAASAGFFRTLGAESARLSFKTVAFDDTESEQFAERLLEESGTADPAGSEIRHRGRERFALNWSEAETTDANVPDSTLRREGVYLITGGAGGVGAHLAEFLAREYAARIVLCGRSAPDARVGELLERLRACGGRAAYVQADVSERWAAESAVERARSEFGALHGVFHLAGVTRDALVVNKRKEQFEEVVAPKVFGTLHLDEATAGEPLDCFVLFSSLASVKANPGQADYAYANHFLNAFAESRGRRVLAGSRSGRTVSVCWPFWEDGAMRVAPEDLETLRTRLGLAPLPTAEAFRCLRTLLASELTQAVVLYGEPSRLSRVFERAGAAAPPEGSPRASRNAASDDAALSARVESLLRRLISEVTQLPPEEIQAGTSFEEYGIDSVIIKGFNRKLEAELGELPTTLLFECRSVGELAAYLLANHAELLREKLGDRDGGDDEPACVVAEAAAPQLNTAAGTGDAVVNVRPTRARRTDIAVVGVGGRYPDAPTLEKFWRNLAAGRDSVGEVPRTRWDVDVYFDANPDRAREGKMYCKWGAFLEDADHFDANFFRISPREAEMMDPQERLFLEVAWQAFEDAGYPPSRLRKTLGEPRPEVGVFVGITSLSYQLFGPEEWSKENHVFPVSAPWSIANRISYLLNLGGPSLPVDTACSSSLYAVHLAVESVRRGECRMALAGGVNLYLHPSKYVGMCQAHMLSARGRCHTFGAEADGFVPGEGVGAIILRPLEDALREGDHVYGVIKGTAVNHGGKTSSYTVPNPLAQAALVRSALEDAGVGADTLSYVEAHGTGTELGDPIEVRGLSLAFADATDRKQFCAVGSLKSNIGHLEAAAGVAGLTKILLQFEHGQLAPSLHAETLNPSIDFARSPLYVQRELGEWRTSRAGATASAPRRAGVSSFGAGGANAHVVLEEPPPAAPRSATPQGPHLVLLSAKTEERLRAYAHALRDFVSAAGGTLDMAEVAYTSQVGREPLSFRLALVVKDEAELLRALGDFVEEQPTETATFRGRVERDRRDPLLLDGEEGRAFVEAVVRRKNLAKLARMWVEGLEVEWEALYGDARPRVTRLPPYPFEKKRYWIPQTRAVAAAANAPKLHPLIESNVSTLREQKFRLSLDPEDFYLRDHIVGGEPVLPGVTYLEMARAAAELASEQAVPVLRNVVWVNRLAARGVKSAPEIRLTPKEGGVVAFAVVSGGAGAEQLHAQGEVRLEEALQARPPVDVASVESRCRRVLRADDCYPPDEGGAAKPGVGVNLGPSLRSIKLLRVGDGEALVELELPEVVRETSGQFVLHPSLLDGALQALLGMRLDADADAAGGKLYFPFSVEKVLIWGALPPRCRAHLQFVGRTDDQRGASEKYNVTFLDEEGRAVVGLEGYVARVVDAKALQPATEAATRLYRVEWVRSERATDAAHELTSPVLLFDEDEALAARVRELRPGLDVVLVRPGLGFRRISEHGFELRAGAAEDYERLFAELATGERLPLNVAFNWTPSAVTLSETAIGQHLERSLYALNAVSRALVSAAAGRGERNVIFVQRADDQSHPFHAGAAGFARSANQERLGLRFKAVAVNSSLRVDELASLLSNEWRDMAEPEVYHDDAGRHLPRLKAFEAAAAPGQAPREGGVCLIAGGTGALGLAFAEYLFEKFRARLVLLSRRPPQAEAAGRVEALRRRGAEVLIVTADLLKREEVFAAVEQARRTFGAVNGVVHAAGVLREGYLNDKLPGAFEEVLGPKVPGAFWLDEATASDPLDFFYACSSTAATLGNAGQTDYAFAHALLDALVKSRHAAQRSGARNGKSLAIDFPIWEEGRGAAVAPSLLEWLDRTMGIRPIPGRVALEVFARALSHDESFVLALHGDAARFERGLHIRRSEPTPAPARTDDAAPHVSRLVPELKRDLSRIAGELLRLPVDEIDVERQLDEFGFESVSLIEFANAINRTFGVEVMPTLFFEHTTVASVAAGLAAQHGAKLAHHYRLRHSEPNDTPPPSEPHTSIPRAATAPDFVTEARPRPAAPESNGFRFAPAREASPRPTAREAAEPVAIVGISGAMPQSDDLEQFWENLVAGRDLITEVPADRWRWQDYDAEAATADKTSRWGGFMREVDKFDPLFFGVSPREAALMDPQHRLFIEHTWRAIENAGHKPSDLSGTRTAVYVGMSVSDYAEVIRTRLSEMEAHAALGISSCMLPNRISFLLNLRGPSEPIDTGCSSAAIAVHRAVQAIRHEGCEFAIAGGVSVMLNPMLNVFFSKSGVMSADHRCRAFDRDATGTIRGEGVGVLLLKPLSLALRDGNPVYAVIRGSAENHGGRSSSLTAPNPDAQAEVIASAWDGLDPDGLGYVEAHGTGTVLGDPVEMKGLKEAFKRLRALRGETSGGAQRVGVGSVKSNVGHLLPAAAMPSLFKVIFGFKRGTIPGNLHFENVNPFIDLGDSPFYVVNRNVRWESPRGRDGRPLARAAGISSFGMGGANAHLVLEEYVPEPAAPAAAGPFIFTLSARDEERLRAYALKLAEHMKRDDAATLEEIAYTLQVGREAMDARLAFVTSEREALVSALEAFAEGRTPQAELLRGGGKAGASTLNHILDAELTSRLLEDSYASGDLKRLGSLWVSGVAVDWARLYERKPRRVALPSYPFARIRCWINEAGRTDLAAVALRESVDVTAAPPETHAREESRSDDVPRPEAVFYDWDWSPVEAAVPARTDAMTLLLFRDDESTGQELRASLGDDTRVVFVRAGDDFARLDANSFVVRADAGDDYTRLLKELDASGGVPSHVAFRWGSVADATRPLTEGAFQIFHLARAYAELQIKRRLRRVVCCRARGDGVSPHFEALAGYANSLPLVFPNLTLSTVDLAGEESADATIRAELLASNPADEIRYEDGRRLVKTFRRSDVRASDGVPLREKGVYLIAGGAGGLGRVFARHLAEKYRARLVLLGRSPLDDERRDTLREIEALGGSAVYVSADVADRASLEAALAEARREFGPLDGVIHAAGTANKVVVTEKSIETFRDTLLTKARGAELLDELTASDGLDFFVMFSSTSVLLGDMAQGDYAVGNRFLDGYAYYRDALRAAGARRGASVSINWPLWREGGIHLEKEAEASALAYTGMHYLETEEGIDAFERILSAPRPQAILIVSTDSARVEEHLNRGCASPAPRAATANARPHAHEPVHAAANGAGRNGAGKNGAAKNGAGANVNELLEGDLRRIASELLNLDERHIDAHTDLVNYGVDSITLATFVSRLNHTFDFLDVNQASLIGAQSLDALVQVLMRSHGEDFSVHYAGGAARGNGNGRKAASAWPPELVTIQTEGAMPPSFWAPGSYGFSQSFRTLPAILGRDFPVYAFHARGNDGRRMPFARLEEMAVHYVECVRHVRPAGPYLLGGYSFGGLVALEMAHQLVRANEEVAGLVLFDTYPPTERIYAMTRNPDENDKMQLVLANMLTGRGEWGDTIRAEDLEGVPARTRDARLVELIVGRGVNTLPPDEIFGFLKGAREVNDYASEAYGSYKPAPYTGSKVLYVKSARGLDEYVADYDYLAVWRELVPRDLEVVEVAHKHSQLLYPAALQDVAGRLRDFLGRASKEQARLG